jgi:sulfotransferase 6B1
MNRGYCILASIFCSFANYCNPYYRDPVPLISSLPKSGTHLIIEIVKLITGRNAVHSLKMPTSDVIQQYYEQGFFFNHAPFSPTNEDFVANNHLKGVFIYRDPRDQVTSFAHYIRKVNLWPHLKKLEVDDLITQLITGATVIYAGLTSANVTTITDFYQSYIPWTSSRNFYSVRFEDLIGPQGGGTREAQITVIKGIAKHLGHHLTDQQALSFGDAVFGNSITFRKGKIGSWKEDFTAHHRNMFKQVAGQLLIDLSYEKDFEW